MFDLEALSEWTSTMVKTLKSFGLILNIKYFLIKWPNKGFERTFSLNTC